MKKLFLLVVLLVAVPAQAEITWKALDDPMTGEKKAAVACISDDGGVLMVRLEGPVDYFILYRPSQFVTGNVSDIQVKFDDDPMSTYTSGAVHSGGYVFWQPILNDADSRAFVAEHCVKSRQVMVRVKTSREHGPVNTFDLMGFRKALLEALAHVE